MKPLFVIPARGGSKGIPDKNIVDLGGRPLLSYSVEGAIRALRALGLEREMERIILSTDSERIAAVGRSEGLTIPFMRPPELSTDTAGSREVILHAMDWADSRQIDYDCVVLLQPTSPFRRVDHILAAMEMFDPSKMDMVVSVCEASANPYYNCFETDSQSGYLHISKGDGLLTRRQDAPRAWEYNGAVYVINPKSIRMMPLGKFPHRVPYPMSREDSLDIDSPLDLEIARILIKNHNASR